MPEKVLLHFCLADFAILDARLPSKEKGGWLENLAKINEYYQRRMRLLCVHTKSVGGGEFERLHFAIQWDRGDRETFISSKMLVKITESF